MKCVQLSGMQKRKCAKENEQKNLSVVAKTGKLTDFFLQTAEKDNPDQNQCQSSETGSESNLSPSSETGSVGARPDFHDDVAHDEVPQPGPTSMIRCVNAFELSRNEGFSDWRNTAVIDNHEKSTTHQDAMLTYLTRKQGLGLTQPLEKQIEEKYNYWENVL
ncbi:UNVERIFIED_CONTAM: hypothetical protein K2H54_065476 [Gekko kuhli]